MTRRDAERLVRRALRDGYTTADIRPWGTGWMVVLTPPSVGGATIYEPAEYDEIEWTWKE